MRIAEELRSALGATATIISDPEILPSYSRDQSQIAKNGVPAAVLLAKDEAEISAAVKFAFEKNIPVIARGAGSGGGRVRRGCGCRVDRPALVGRGRPVGLAAP